MKKILCAILSAALISVSAVPAFAAETSDKSETAVTLKEGTYAPNQVVVKFKDSAIDTDTVPKKGEVEAVGAGFGDMQAASSSEQEALGAADEEADILYKSLGGDFVLEDTLVFDTPQADSKAGDSVGASANATGDGFSVALVSSDKYDTATLIEKLSKVKGIEKVEPNYYVEAESFDDYSLNDEYSSYLYQANSPAAKNTSGDSVSDRGIDPETAISVNASSAWSKLGGDEKEAVVAVVDSYINIYYQYANGNGYFTSLLRESLTAGNEYFPEQFAEETDSVQVTVENGLIRKTVNSGYYANWNEREPKKWLRFNGTYTAEYGSDGIAKTMSAVFRNGKDGIQYQIEIKKENGVITEAVVKQPDGSGNLTETIFMQFSLLLS